MNIVPFWGLCLIGTCVTYTAPLIYVTNRETIDGMMNHTSEMVNTQATQLKDLTAQHTGNAAETIKAYAGDYTAKAQQVAGDYSAKAQDYMGNKAPAQASATADSIKQTASSTTQSVKETVGTTSQSIKQEAPAQTSVNDLPSAPKSEPTMSEKLAHETPAPPLASQNASESLLNI